MKIELIGGVVNSQNNKNSDRNSDNKDFKDIFIRKLNDTGFDQNKSSMSPQAVITSIKDISLDDVMSDLKFQFNDKMRVRSVNAYREVMNI